MAKLNCTQVVRNIIASHIDNAVWTQTQHKDFALVKPKDITLEQTGPDYIDFTAQIKVHYRDFSVHGFVNQFGTPTITSIRYERRKCKLGEDGWPDESTEYTEHGFIWGDNLKTFAFDK